MTNSNPMEYDASTDGVRIGVQLTATTVHLDSVVLTAELTMSRAETLRYIFTAIESRFAAMNVAFPEKVPPGNWTRVKAEICTPLHCLVLLHFGFEI